MWIVTSSYFILKFDIFDDPLYLLHNGIVVILLFAWLYVFIVELFITPSFVSPPKRYDMYIYIHMYVCLQWWIHIYRQCIQKTNCSVVRCSRQPPNVLTQLSWLHRSTILHLTQFSFFIPLTTSCIYELMGLTESIEQSSDPQLCIHMYPMEQRKERTYINVLSVSFFLFFLYMWLPSIRWCTYIYTHRISSHVHIQPYFVSFQTHKSDHQRLFFLLLNLNI